MMTAEGFRRIALGMKDAAEGAHMGHPDFRTGGRIFATLHADGRKGMVKLTPQQQQELVREQPAVFEPESGAWGREGCTRVHLASAGEETIGAALTLAWQNADSRPAGPARQRPTPPRAGRRKR
jgi:hypothetical protein